MSVFGFEIEKQVWPSVPIEEVADVNPRLDKSSISDSTEVTFVPMPAVEAESGAIDTSEIRPFAEVKKGYTAFREGDVLFAKITPCMENGKMAVVPALTNGLGFGSTEFHVLRPTERVIAPYLYYFVSSKAFRVAAEHVMTGAVGQKRVPTPVISGAHIPLPPMDTQRRIVEKIESLFAEIDQGVAALERARKQLEVYRQAVLKHAFEGKLTEKWREENQDKLESPEELLERIRTERVKEYERQVKDWSDQIAVWEEGGKQGKRPSKPRMNTASDVIVDSLDVPLGWGVERIGNLNAVIFDGPFGSNLKSSDYTSSGVRVVRLENIGALEFKDSVQSFISLEKYETLKKHTLQSGDIIVASFVVDSVRATQLTPHIGTAINKADCFCIRIIGQSIDPGYLLKYLCSKVAYTHLKSEIHGVGRPRINTTQLKSLPVPICTHEEQRLISETIDDALGGVVRQLEIIDQAIHHTLVLRQSILQDAFSGDLIN